MATRMRFEAVVVVAVVLGVASACSSSSPTGGGGTGSSGGTGGDGSGSGSGGSGGGDAPCKSGDQTACDECVAAASKTCNATVCREEDLALENCSVASVYLPCEDATGNESIDCCQLEGRMLIECWNRCPEMKTCG